MWINEKICWPNAWINNKIFIKIFFLSQMYASIVYTENLTVQKFTMQILDIYLFYLYFFFIFWIKDERFACPRRTILLGYLHLVHNSVSWLFFFFFFFLIFLYFYIFLDLALCVYRHEWILRRVWSQNSRTCMYKDIFIFYLEAKFKAAVGVNHSGAFCFSVENRLSILRTQKSLCKRCQ